MKQGWTYKTFGEVGSFLRGKSIQKADFIENGFPCIHYGQIHTKFGVSVDKHLSEIPLKLYNKSIIASHGDVIIAITSEDLEGSCKSTAWLGDYDVAVSSHAVVFKHSINPKFIAYYLRSKSFYYEKMKYARGFKVVEIKPIDIERIPIPVPPIAEQERIVAELDLLSGIIEKKKAQLKAYDQLAQSIFYTTFGDPITNEKGWEVKKLHENVHEMFLGPFGSALKVDSYVPKEDAYCMIYEQKHAIRGTINLDNHYINKEKFESLQRFEVKPHDFIMSCRGTIGKLYQLPKDAPKGIIHPSLMKIRIKEEFYNSTFFQFLLVKIVANESTNGNCVQMAITAKELGKKELPLPPLSLQREFAEKVEAIERQKALVQQSIEETQTMFDYTMDKYFG